MFTLTYTDNTGGSKTITAAVNGFVFVYSNVAPTREWKGNVYCPHCEAISETQDDPFALDTYSVEDLDTLFLDEMYLHGPGKCCDE